MKFTHMRSDLTLNVSTSLPSNSNAPIWSMSIEIHGKFLLGRLLLSSRKFQYDAALKLSYEMNN